MNNYTNIIESLYEMDKFQENTTYQTDTKINFKI